MSGLFFGCLLSRVELDCAVAISSQALFASLALSLVQIPFLPIVISLKIQLD